MDLTEFEQAKLKLVDARKIVEETRTVLEAAQARASEATNAIGDIKREIHLAFLATGGIVVRISNDGDMYERPQLVSVLKAGLVADRQVGKLSQDDFSLLTVEGQRIYERYHQFYSRAGHHNREQQFAALCDALCSLGILDAEKNRMIVCDYHYFVREVDGWKELSAE